MSEEKLKILQMIQDGKVNAAEGLELLKALEESESVAANIPLSSVPNSRLANRFLRVKVNTEDTTIVNVNLPLSLLKVASKFATFGLNYIPETARQEMAKKGINLSQLDLEELQQMIEQGLTNGKLLDVEVNDPHEGLVKVEVYVEEV